MADDNSERLEVDLLIKELASRRSKLLAAKAAATAVAPAAASAPAPTQNRFISAINVRNLPGGFSLPKLPKLRLPPLPSLPELRTLASLNLPTRETVRVWSWVGLGALLSVAMLYWPYSRTGIWSILFYAFAVAMVIVAGVWGAQLTWKTRLGIAHTIALVVLLWGITLGAAETFPHRSCASTEAGAICPLG